MYCARKRSRGESTRRGCGEENKLTELEGHRAAAGFGTSGGGELGRSECVSDNNVDGTEAGDVIGEGADVVTGNCIGGRRRQ